jgi:hypothetical protein
MQLELKGLIIDKTSESLELLEAALNPDVVFEYIDLVNTVHKAIEYHMDMVFDLCFISEEFPEDEVKSFFTDFAKLEKKDPCVFIQFRKTCDIDLDRESLKSAGFAAIISTTGDHKDKEYLWKALKPFLNRRKYAEAVEELDSVVEKLLTEVDRIALEHKRGKKKKLNNVVSRYLQDTSQEFEKIKEVYMDKLLEESINSAAFEPIKVDVPEDVLGKKLPHLYKDGYKGQSHRVSSKVNDLHGEPLNKQKNVTAQPSEDNAEADQASNEEPQE